MDQLDMLIQFLPYAPLIAFMVALLFFLKYWKKIKQVIKDLLGFYFELRENRYASRINPKIRQAFLSSRKKAPILNVYRDIYPLEYKFDKKATAIEIVLEPEKALAIIPVRGMDNILSATHVYASEYMSQFSSVRDYKKLQKAMDIFVVLVVVQNSELNGSLKIATEQFFNKAKEDEELAILLDIIEGVNGLLKEQQVDLDSRLTRILLVETCRCEFCENDRLFE